MNVDSLLHLSNVACQAESLENDVCCEDDKSTTSQSVQSSPRQSGRAPKYNNGMKAADSIQVVSSRVGIVAESDRVAVREKIKSAFKKKTETYEHLLELSSQLIEENVISNAPSKLDYYKSGIACCKRIFEISNSSQGAGESSSAVSEGKGNEGEDGGPKPVKRVKTQH